MWACRKYATCPSHVPHSAVLRSLPEPARITHTHAVPTHASTHAPIRMHTSPQGEGTFGKVYKGLWRGSVVAVKTVLLPAMMSGAEVGGLMPFESV